MDLLIGKVIIDLRKEKGVTQEQLADAVGVSAPAVSKWETGNAYPDITLLPSIARFFGVTVDTLLSFERDMSDEQVMQIDAECAEKFEKAGFDEGIGCCERYLREYPNNLFLKFRIAGLLNIYSAKADSAEKREVAEKLVISLLEAAAQSKAVRIKLAAMSTLASLYIAADRLEQAESLLQDIPRTDINPDIVLSALYRKQGKTEEAQRLEQKNLYRGITAVYLSLQSLASDARRDKSFQRAIRLAGAQRELIRLFELEKFMMLSNCGLFLSIYTDLQDGEKALEYMDEYVECIAGLDYEKMKLSDIDFFNLIDNSRSGMSCSSGFIREGLADELEHDSRYDFIRGTKRYKEIIKKLRNG